MWSLAIGRRASKQCWGVSAGEWDATLVFSILHFHPKSSTDPLSDNDDHLFCFLDYCLLFWYNAPLNLVEISIVEDFILVWPTCRTPAVGGLIACE